MDKNEKWRDEPVIIVAADSDARTVTVILPREVSGIKIGDNARITYRQHITWSESK